MDGATSDIATDSSVNSSTGGKQGKGAKGAQAKGKGAKGKPDPFGDIYDNPMVIPLHAEPRTSSRKSGGSFVAPLRDENNNTPADLDEDERARSIGAGHEVRSASTSSHDSGFYGGGTAPISPKKALGKSQRKGRGPLMTVRMTPYASHPSNTVSIHLCPSLSKTKKKVQTQQTTEL